jgi:hypothetical protein
VASIVFASYVGEYKIDSIRDFFYFSLDNSTVWFILEFSLVNDFLVAIQNLQNIIDITLFRGFSEVFIYYFR